jgi:hypothetical protein
MKELTIKQCCVTAITIVMAQWLALAAVPTSTSIDFNNLGAEATKSAGKENFVIQPVAGGYALRCALQDIVATVTSRNVKIESVSENEGQGAFTLQVSAIGRNAGLVALARDASTVMVSNNVVTTVRPGLIEEFSTSADGVRQDFVISDRPNGSGEMRLLLNVNGAQVYEKSGGVALKMASGRELIYGKLNVTDAAGKALPARFTSGFDNAIEIVVDDRDAVYPIRIDPTIADGDWVGMGIYPGVNGDVNTIVYRAGYLYFGGAFTAAGGNANANRIAKWDGSSWTNMGSGLNGVVRAMVFDATGTLYVGGDFTDAGGDLAADRIATWDGFTWGHLGTGIANLGVYTIALENNGDLHVGGTFTVAGGSPGNFIAKFTNSTDTWSALSSQVSAVVYALVSDGNGSLYAGGNFLDAGGIGAADRIAKWDGTSWSALGAGIQNANPVYALLLNGSDLFVGGAFIDAGGNTSADYIGKWNGTQWINLGAGISGGDVRTIIKDGNGNYYIGGNFTLAGGVGRLRIAKWDGSAWNTMGDGFSSYVYSLCFDGSANLYAAGNFTLSGNTPTRRIAKWSGTIWNPLTTGLDGQVRASVVDAAGNLYIGGDFTAVGGITAMYVARWTGSGWSTMGQGMNGSVYCLQMRASNGHIYAGGSFTTADGASANRVARWGGSSWNNLNTGIANLIVHAISLENNGDLHVGGTFTVAGGSPGNYIAKWTESSSSWSALSSEVNAAVYALASNGSGILYAGGSFTDAGTILAADRIAKWDGASWSALGAGIQNAQPVTALLLSGTDLYVGGNFADAGGNTNADRIAKWDGTNWNAFGGGTFNGQVNAIVLDRAGTLFVGGAFGIAGGGVNATRIAQWNGSVWNNLGSTGLDNTINALSVDSSGSIYAGGAFGLAAGLQSTYLAKCPNVRPTGANDAYSTNEDVTLNGSSVLTNDVHSDGGQTLTASLVTDVSHGSLTLNSNGTFSYSPTANYNGSDNFIYRAGDGRSYSANTTVTITINPVTDNPTTPTTPLPAAVSTRKPEEALSWTASTDPDAGDEISYVLEVSRVSNFATVITRDTTTAVSKVLNTLKGHHTFRRDTTYYWRVKAFDNNGGVSTSWAGGATQTIVFASVVPNALTLATPASLSSTTNLRQMFTWNAATSATVDTFTYNLEVSTSSGFGSFAVRQNALSVAYFTLTSDLTDNTIYYWRVWAKGLYNDSTLCAANFTLYTNVSNDPPNASTLSSPANASATVNLTPALNWSDATDPDPVNNSVTYTLEIARNSGFTTHLQRWSALATSDYTVLVGDTIKGNQTYYWRVYTKDLTPDSTVSTNTFTFITPNTAPSAVALTSPTNAANGVLKTGQVFDWADGTDADPADVGNLKYILEIDDNTGFSSIDVRKTGLTESNYTTIVGDGLAGNKTYYWRVYTKDTKPDSTRSSNAYFSFTTQNTVPVAFNLTSPADGNSVSRTPLLDWSDATDPDPVDESVLSYVVEISTASNFSSPIRKTSSTSTYQVQLLDGLTAPTPYYWRVYAKDTYPDSTQSIQNWRFTTYPNLAPNAFNLGSPPDGNSASQTPTLDWDSTTDADNNPLTFILEIDDNNLFTSVNVRKTGLTVTNNTINDADNLSGNTRYYWRVWAKDSYPDSTLSTSTYSFRTPNHAPGAFALSTPTNASVVTTTPTLDWANSVDVDVPDSVPTYILEIDDNSGFTSIDLRKTGIVGSTYTVVSGDGLVGHKTYYWRVYAKDTYPDSTLSTNSLNFITQNTAPSTFSLVSPANGVNQTVIPLLDWDNATDVDPVDASALTYSLEVSTVSTFSPMLFRRTGLASSTYQVLLTDNLAKGTTYYWRVYAKDTYPDSTASAYRSFVVVNNPPDAFALTAPANAAVVTKIPTLDWADATEPDTADSTVKYTLEVDDNAGFSSVNLRVINLTQSTYTVLSGDNLVGHRTYYWRVYALDTYPDSTISSSTRSFVTQNTMPSTVTLTAPANASSQDILPLLDWSDASDADPVDAGSLTYIVEIDDANDFSSPNVRRTGLSSSTYQVQTGDNLQRKQTYYWRVYAKDTYPDSSASASGNFTTYNNAPAAFALVSPSDGSSVSSTPLIDWATATEPDTLDSTVSYTLEIDDNNAFSSINMRKTGITQSYYQMLLTDNLTAPTTYYWRVYAKDSYGDSTLSSATYAFTTYGNRSPNPVSLTSPTDGALVANLVPLIDWDTTTDADNDPLTFILEVDNNADFSSLTMRKSGLSLTRYQVTGPDGLEYHQTYYWRVYAKDTRPDSSLSSTFTFRTPNNPPNTFALSTPGNGSTVSLAPTLDWADATDPDPSDITFTYVVEIDDNSGFNSINVRKSVASVSQYTVLAGDNLKGHTTYYWRVWAKDSYPDSVLSSGSLSFVTQNTAPTAVALVAPFNATAQNIIPLLDWEDATDADPVDAGSLTYRLEIDNNSDFSSVYLRKNGLASSNYQVQIADNLLRKTTYYWRVYSVDTYPDSTISTSVRNFTTLNAAPGSFSLQTPVDGSEASMTPSLNWTDSDDPDTVDSVAAYVLEIDDNSDFSSPTVRKTSLTASQYAVQQADGLTAPKTYYWRVWAKDSYNDSTLSSNTYSFVTYANHSPEPFALTSPADNILTSTAPLLDWADATDQDGNPITYMVDIDDNSDFSSITVRRTALPTSTYTVTLSDGLKGHKTYYWRAWAKDNRPDSTLSTSVFSFRTQNNAPTVFTLASPSSNATVSKTPLLDWANATDPDPTDTTFTYTLEIDDANDFSSVNVRRINLSNSQYQVQASDNLTGHATYYWRVRALDSYPDSVSCATVFSFHTQNSAPGTFTLGSPANTSSQTVIPLLDWADATDADPVDAAGITYMLEIDDNAAFTSINVRRTGLSASNYQIQLADNLVQKQVYYWRVYAKDTYPDSTLSTNTFTFTTINRPPDAFSLLTPADGSENPAIPLLDWQSATEPDTMDSTVGYVVEIDDNSDFSSLVLRKTNQIQSQYQVQLSDNLKGHMMYYWRVYARDAYPDSTISTNVLSFKTQNTKPSAVTLLTPVNNSGTSATPMLDWSDGSDVDPTDVSLTYVIEIDNNSNFSSPEVRKAGLTSSNYQVLTYDNLTGHTTYYWRVYTKDSYPDSTVSSSTFAFSTQNSAPTSFTLISPADASLSTTIPLLDWADATDPDPGETGNLTYKLEIDDNSDFSSVYLRKTGLSASQYQVQLADNLARKVTYYWRAWVKDTYPDSTLSANSMSLTTVNNPPDAFALLTPSDGTLGTVTPMLDWNNATEPDTADSTASYVLEVSDIADFSTIALRKTGITTSLYQVQTIDGLKGHKTYYWRIYAKDTYPDSTLSSNTLSFKTYNNAPTGSTLLTPLVNSEVSVLPLLDWSDATDVDPVDVNLTYILEVDDNNNFTSINLRKFGLATSQYQVIVNDALKGHTTYYWRVYAKDTNPDSTVSINSLSFKTQNNIPGAFSLATPALNAEVTATPVLDWSDAVDVDTVDMNAITYILEIDDSSSFATPVVRKPGLSQSTYLVTAEDNLKGHKSYWWRVYAKDTYPDSIVSANVLQFRTRNNVPAAFTLTSPGAGTLTSTAPLLDWQNSSDADSVDMTTLVYSLEISSVSDFSQIILRRTGLGSSQYQIVAGDSLKGHLTYYWRVYARDTYPDSSLSTNSLSFSTVNTAPGAATLLAPVNDSLVSQIPLLDWSDAVDVDTVDASLKYILEIDNDNDFSSITLRKTNLTQSRYQVAADDNLAGHAKYYWRVYAKDTYPDSTVSTNVLSFKTQNHVPQEFDLVSPNNNKEVTTTPLFVWQAADDLDPSDVGKISYILEIDDSLSFATPVYRKTGITNPQFQIGAAANLADNSTYYWRVYAKDTYPDSTLSASTLKFFTDNGNDAPTLSTPLFPSNNSERGMSDSLNWTRHDNDPADALRYNIRLSLTNDFTSIVASKTLWGSARILLSDLDNNDSLKDNTLYYWQVEAIDPDNLSSGYTSGGGAWFYCNRTNDRPTQPHALKPSDNTALAAANVLAWQVEDADSLGLTPDTLRYTVTVSVSPDFANPIGITTVFADSVRIDSLVNFASMAEDAHYYWKVFATDNHGLSGLLFRFR